MGRREPPKQVLLTKPFGGPDEPAELSAAEGSIQAPRRDGGRAAPLIAALIGHGTADWSEPEICAAAVGPRTWDSLL